MTGLCMKLLNGTCLFCLQILVHATAHLLLTYSVVCLAYCHDQGHRIYFSLPPSFLPTEFTLCLPCDDELWAAKTAAEWSQLLFTPSPYGGIEERLHGVPMPCAFAAVGLEGPNMTAIPTASPEPPKELDAVSPFGHFILLHALLGELFRRCSRIESPASTPAPETGEEQVNEHVYVMQLALHRWLQMWLKTPNAGNPLHEAEKATGYFMADPVPFYWLAQLLLLAFQEGHPPFQCLEAPPVGNYGPPNNSEGLHEPSPFAPPTSSSSSSMFPFAPSPFLSSNSSSASSPETLYTPPGTTYMPSARTPLAPKSGDQQMGGNLKGLPDAAQFRLIKSWLHHIRLFLRRTQGSTVVWDELMKIRLSGWEEVASSLHGDGHMSDCNDDDWLEGRGLVGFFEEKLRI
jgi:hypothetical protein